MRNINKKPTTVNDAIRFLAPMQIQRVLRSRDRKVIEVFDNLRRWDELAAATQAATVATVMKWLPPPVWRAVPRTGIAARLAADAGVKPYGYINVGIDDAWRRDVRASAALCAKWLLDVEPGLRRNLTQCGRVECQRIFYNESAGHPRGYCPGRACRRNHWRANRTS